MWATYVTHADPAWDTYVTHADLFWCTYVTHADPAWGTYISHTGQTEKVRLRTLGILVNCYSTIDYNYLSFAISLLTLFCCFRHDWSFCDNKLRHREASLIKKLGFACSLMGLNFFDTLCRSDKQSHKILIERFIDDLSIYGI